MYIILFDCWRMFSSHLLIVLLLLLLLSYEITSLNERVEFQINNTTTITFYPNTEQQIHLVPVATTNIQLVCYPDDGFIHSYVTPFGVISGSTVTINSFTSNEDGVYECRQNELSISVYLQATGHGVFYISNGEYGTISTEESEVAKQLILKPDQLYRVICSGDAAGWRHTNDIYLAGCNGEVCQETVSDVESALVFEESSAPFEYVCRVNIDLKHHRHKIEFISEGTVIPQNIRITTNPFFPLINGIITVRSLEVSILCSCEAYPPVTPDNYSIYYKSFTPSNMKDVVSDFDEHGDENMVTCYVDNGISRDETVFVIFNFSVEIPYVSIASITTNIIGFTWEPVSQYLEEHVVYKTSYTNDVNMEVNTFTYGNNTYSEGIDGLVACSEYEIQVMAYIYEIEDRADDVILVTTLPEEISESPLQLITQSTGSRHVFISWPEVSTRSCTLYPINYTISYQSVSPDTISSGIIVLQSTEANRLGSRDFYAIIPGLEEYYEYEITVFASNWRGDGPATTVTVTTKATVPSSTPQSLRLQERTHLTWDSPAVIHQNGIIYYYIVEVVNIYTDKDPEVIYRQTADTFIDIKRDEEAVKIEISVRAVNQVGEGPEATLHITLNPYKELPEIEDSVLLLDVSLLALESKQPNERTITPTQTSILVESLTRSLQGVNLTKESSVQIELSYFQDLIKACSLLWESGILPNEGQSVSPSKNYVDFLGIVDFLSLLYSDFYMSNSKFRRETPPSLSSSNLESDNLHLSLFNLESGEFQSGPLTLTVNSVGMLSHIQIDNPFASPEDTGSVNDVIFSDKIHNFNFNTENADISAIIRFNSSAGMNHECAFFNTDLNKWDTTGIVTRVTPKGVNCETNHFTSFGVLVRPFDAGLTREQNLALSVVTYILLSISLILLAIAIVLYIVTYKITLRVEGNIVYFNYAISLFLATGTFIFGIQTATNSYPGCFVVTVLMHYTWLAVFAWSLCIGMMLFYKIFFVFSERRISLYLMIFGWGAPVIVVTIAAGTANAYYIRTGDDHCWLSQENGLIWSFIGPILIILLVNIVLLVMSTVKIFRSMASFKKDRIRALRVSLLSAAIMVPVLNTPWLLLLLFTIGISAYSIIVEWMFVFLNASNGILFFFLFVLRNNEIRKSLKSGKYTKWMFTLWRDGRTDRNSGARLSSKYVLKKQRTTDSYVESGMRKSLGDSIEIQDTKSPRSSIGTEFPQPLTKPPTRTKGGFVSLQTQDEVTIDEHSYYNESDQPTTTEETQPEPIYSKVDKKPKEPQHSADQVLQPEPREHTPVQDPVD